MHIFLIIWYIIKNKISLCSYLEVVLNKVIKLIMKKIIKEIVRGEKLDIYLKR